MGSHLGGAPTMQELSCVGGHRGSGFCGSGYCGSGYCGSGFQPRSDSPREVAHGAGKIECFAKGPL